MTTAPYGGSVYPVEARMDERIFARFHLDAGIDDMVLRLLENNRAPELAWDSPASNRRVSR